MASWGSLAYKQCLGAYRPLTDCGHAVVNRALAGRYGGGNGQELRQPDQLRIGENNHILTPLT
jgi:hypothetical protein